MDTPYPPLPGMVSAVHVPPDPRATFVAPASPYATIGLPSEPTAIAVSAAEAPPGLAPAATSSTFQSVPTRWATHSPP